MFKTARDQAPNQSRVGDLGWAVFLGMSWTWCIGMFLPVLLVRDYGTWGWIVFAIPNVVGAAAMGWVLRSPDSSRQIVVDHWHACVAFSIVTILFHFFFITWMLERLIGHQAIAIIAAVVIPLLLARRRTAIRTTALVVLVSSIAAIVILRLNFPRPQILPELSRRDLFFLTPVCIFGFALCPYLDLTFHRARAAIDNLGSKIAFTLGFGIFFFAMIAFSLWYAPFLPRWIVAGANLSPNFFTYVLGAYMAAQIGFTIGIHLEAIDIAKLTSRKAILFILLSVAVLLAGLSINELERQRPRIYHGLEIGEVVYRSFMGFYGLVFPAYVWLCMIPGRGRKSPPRSIRIFALSIVLALPFFWTGFIENRMMYLAPGLAIVLLARLFISTRLTMRS